VVDVLHVPPLVAGRRDRRAVDRKLRPALIGLPGLLRARWPRPMSQPHNRAAGNGRAATIVGARTLTGSEISSFTPTKMSVFARAQRSRAEPLVCGDTPHSYTRQQAAAVTPPPASHLPGTEIKRVMAVVAVALTTSKARQSWRERPSARSPSSMPCTRNWRSLADSLKA
jgi:hypothetical protein